MTLQIEAGKYYRTRGGRKVGPFSYDPRGRHPRFPWATPEDFAWANDGSFAVNGHQHNLDLIAEWTDKPAPLPEQYVLYWGPGLMAFHKPGLATPYRVILTADGKGGWAATVEPLP